ncbi:CRISPR system Cascade subunit CasA [Kineothrix alysoides]|uniref:CRISPR system Cascade subunit CasA n=1 Tax=Kineothrix alysoides TaxID=1469948 RepID=A0A4R1QXV0_9FIRM|nr:type I-E CRISPR-associated protein Cse1/CasA [Kineothrix alysoides]TCL56340.1 CRISPR system Cascade subunit CasA [Kineothrix alysoides]
MSQFNLLDEKWLMVMIGEKGETEEVSLKELFGNAHQYKRLVGETPTQDFAVLRLLLAVLNTVFTRFTAMGECYEGVAVDADTFQVREEIDEDDILEYKEDLYMTWKALWEKGEFPDIVNDYLEKYRHRFYLLDEKYPFFQFPEIGEPDYPYSATDNGINKLNGKILEGDPRKPRLFMSQYQTGLPYSAAARWLLYTNGYAPSKSGNPGKKKKRESTGVAYLGKLGGIYASGKNLFETLLLNLNLPENACVQKPIWEAEPKINQFQAIPDNLAQLFTYPSRQLLLKADEDHKIIEYRLDLAVSNFEYEPNLKIEPFTFWRYDTKLDVGKWKEKEGFVPKRHDPDKYFWQEMQTFSSIEEKNYNPGIIEWLRRLQGDKLVTGLISLNAVAENYIQKDGVVDRQVYDQINENIDLLDKQENGWLTCIAEEIKNTEKVIGNTVIRFARDIDKIRNLQNGATEQKIKTQIFFSIDRRFREWLISISPQDEKKERTREWKNILREEIAKQGGELIQEAGSRDYLGYYTDKNKSKLENIETAYIRFRTNLKRELGVRE